MPTATPWGASQFADKVCRGIVFYTTSGHGGYHVSKTLNKQIHPALRNATHRGDGWYEEDCDWAAVPFTFPSLFKPQTVEQAIQLLKQYRPDEYEAITGTKIAPGESRIRDEQAFYLAHENDFVVVAAWGDWHERVPDGWVAVVAVRGRNKAEGEKKYFLVSKEEYRTRRRFAFVIDQTKHKEIDPIR